MKLTFLQKKYFFEGRIDNYRCKTYLGQTLQKTIIPLLSSPLENAAETVSFYQSVLSLLDMPDGLVSGFRRFLLQIFQLSSRSKTIKKSTAIENHTYILFPNWPRQDASD